MQIIQGFIIINDNIVYLKIHKCGSTAVRSALSGEVKHIDKFENIDKPVFSVVRNPYSRLVSCWANRVVGGGWENSFGGGRGELMGLKRNMSFESFVQVISKLEDEESDEHFVSMSYLIDYFIRRPLDLTLKIERLQKDWEMLKNYDDDKISVKSPKVKKKSNHNPWYSYYKKNPILIDLVYKRYESDFVNFNYERMD